MTVENWLRGHFHGLGEQIERNVLEVAAISPLRARPHHFRVVSLEDAVEEYVSDDEYMKGLTYALSTLYYSMSAAITGGTKSEKRGNRTMTIGGYPLTTKDREAFRALGDKLRRELGAELDEDVTDMGGMFDASGLRTEDVWRSARVRRVIVLPTTDVSEGEESEGELEEPKEEGGEPC